MHAIVTEKVPLAPGDGGASTYGKNGNVQLVEELNTATMTLPFNTKEDETERHDDDEGADAGVFTPEMSGNVPVEVVSMMTGLPADKSFEVAAAVVGAAAAVVGAAAAVVGAAVVVVGVIVVIDASLVK